MIEFLRENVLLEVFKFFFIAIGSYYLFDNWLGFIKRKIDMLFRFFLPKLANKTKYLSDIEHRVEIRFRKDGSPYMSKSKVLAKSSLIAGGVAIQLQNEDGTISEVFGTENKNALILQEYEKDRLGFPAKVSVLKIQNTNDEPRLIGTSSYLNDQDPEFCITLFCLVPQNLEWYLETNIHVRNILRNLT